MTEWGVVTALGVLAGLIGAIVTPLVKLIKAISKLTAMVEYTEKSLNELTTDNRSAHKRLWDHNTKQDEAIKDHEVRIGVLEHTKK